MRLGFYLERVYPPYAKWFGTAFRRLRCADVLHEPRARTLAATTWQDRDRAWEIVLRRLVGLHERAGLLPPGRFEPAAVYSGRPGTGIAAFGPGSIDHLIAEIRAHTSDAEIRVLPRWLGSINQLVACRDLNADALRWRAWFVSLV